MPPDRPAGALAALERFLDHALPTTASGFRRARYRPALDRQASAAERLEAVSSHAHVVHRTLRRRLRTFALDRGGGLRRGSLDGADTAEALAKALAAAAAKGTPEQKRALIEAHPDLAGKLALAKTLTAESTREQASAGLDRLTPDELRQFGELNDAYRARFGFPFIMAVKGKSTADILAAFRARLANDADAETKTALAEIDRIAALRLKDILS